MSKSNKIRAQVARAFSANHAERQLRFLATDTVSVPELTEILSAIVPRYNNFSARKVCNWLAKHAPAARVWIGREYSPCLYVEASADDLARIQSLAERARLADEIHRYRVSDGAVCGYESLTGYRFTADVLRLWFD